MFRVWKNILNHAKWNVHIDKKSWNYVRELNLTKGSFRLVKSFGFKSLESSGYLMENDIQESGCARLTNVNSDINCNYDHIKNIYIQYSQTQSSGKDCFEAISVNMWQTKTQG